VVVTDNDERDVLAVCVPKSAKQRLVVGRLPFILCDMPVVTVADIIEHRLSTVIDSRRRV